MSQGQTILDFAGDAMVWVVSTGMSIQPHTRESTHMASEALGMVETRGFIGAIEAADATAFFLPAYSPDLNPIEQVFSKLKALLRKAAERTIPGLWRRIRSILRTVSARECLNFFRHAGYE